MEFVRFETTPFIDKELKRADFTKNFVGFFKLNNATQESVREYCRIERIHKWLLISGVDISKENINEYIEDGANRASKPEAHCVHSFLKAEKYLEEHLEQLNIKTLEKAHEILMRRTPFDVYGGKLRTKAIEMDNNTAACPAKDIERELQKIIKIFHYNRTSGHPLIKGWTVYLLCEMIKPFEKGNFPFAILLMNLLLKKEGYDMSQSLFLEKFLFDDWNAHRSSFSNSLFEMDYKTSLKEDKTAFFENALALSAKNFKWIKEWISEKYLEELNYDSLSPLQKNSLNYFIERGFELNHNHIFTLNARQQAIIKHLAEKHTVVTKEMVQIFRCDRKTIQRDFSDIMGYDLIKQTGVTKTVHYSLNFASRGKRQVAILAE